MKKSREELKLLLLQIRDQQKFCQEELNLFLKYCKLNQNQIETLNLFETEEFDSSILNEYDALLVGGATGATALDPQSFPFAFQANRLISDCIEGSFPVFASCFGFQLAV